MERDREAEREERREENEETYKAMKGQPGRLQSGNPRTGREAPRERQSCQGQLAAEGEGDESRCGFAAKTPRCPALGIRTHSKDNHRTSQMQSLDHDFMTGLKGYFINFGRKADSES
jgi:hypothetical protein